MSAKPQCGACGGSLPEPVAPPIDTEAAEVWRGLRGQRKCERCRGPGPCLWDDGPDSDRTGRYLCCACHSTPQDIFFREAAAAIACHLPADVLDDLVDRCTPNALGTIGPRNTAPSTLVRLRLIGIVGTSGDLWLPTPLGRCVASHADLGKRVAAYGRTQAEVTRG